MNRNKLHIFLNAQIDHKLYTHTPRHYATKRDCTRQRKFVHWSQQLPTDSLCLRDNHRDRVRKERMRVRNCTRERGLPYTNAQLNVSLYRAQMLPTHSLGLCVNHTRVSGTHTVQHRRRIAPMSNSCKDIIHIFCFPEQRRVTHLIIYKGESLCVCVYICLSVCSHMGVTFLNRFKCSRDFSIFVE
jgi:hypothetical protein